MAFNSEGDARSTANVAIKTRMKEGVPKSSPSFARPLGDVSVDEGQKLRITTPVKGNPVPTFSWTKDGQPINADRVHFFSDGELVSSLDGKKTFVDSRLTDPKHTEILTVSKAQYEYIAQHFS